MASLTKSTCQGRVKARARAPVQVTWKAMRCAGRTSKRMSHSLVKRSTKTQGKMAASDPFMIRVRAMISAATAVAARMVRNQ
jgi:hypothetical protein